jgi:hypothetical protein
MTIGTGSGGSNRETKMMRKLDILHYVRPFMKFVPEVSPPAQIIPARERIRKSVFGISVSAPGAIIPARERIRKE